MSAITAEKVLKRLNYLIEKSGFKIDTLAVVTDIPAANLIRNCAGHGEFTINDLTKLCHVLSYPMSRLFSEADPTEFRPCTDPTCTEKRHEWQNGEMQDYCRNHRFERDDEKCEYFVEVQRWDGEPWTCHGVFESSEDGEPGLQAIDAYRRDYVEALAIAARLNVGSV